LIYKKLNYLYKRFDDGMTTIRRKFLQITHIEIIGQRAMEGKKRPMRTNEEGRAKPPQMKKERK